MKKGGYGSQLQAGFTIVEVLIVLAVTAVMLVSAMIMIAGKQRGTEFQVASRQMQQQFEQLINESASGYYPNDGNSFSCTYQTPNLKIQTGGGNAPLGTNNDCVFFGKAVVVNTNNYTVYSLASARQDAFGNDVSQLSDTHATVIDVANVTQTVNLPTGLRYVSNSVGSAPLGPGPLVTVFYNNGANFGSQHSGSQVLSLGVITSGTTVTTINGEYSKVGAFGSSSPPSSVQYCFASDSVNNSVLVTIGGGASGLGVKTDIKSGTSC